MNKEYFLSILEKYNLNDLINKTKIQIKNKEINIDCISPNKDLIVKIEAKNEQIPDLDIILGIYDSKQLIKLVDITDGDLFLKIEELKGICKKLFITDGKVKLEFILADLNLIPNTASVKDIEYPINFNIDSDFITKFIKTKKSLDTDIVTIESKINKDGTKIIRFIAGGKKDYNHKVNLSIPVEEIGIPGWNLNFSVSYIKEILDNNKDMKEGKCFINEEGLMKFEFISENEIKSTYILVAKEE